MKSETFKKIASISGLLVVIAVFVLVWYSLASYAIILTLLWFVSIYVMKGFVKEPLIDERDVEIQRISSSWASRLFALLIMLAILFGGELGIGKCTLSVLEVVLAIFLTLKLVFTKYFEMMI